MRGHGKSSVDLQLERSAKFGRKPPTDLAWEWDIDSYFLYDIPAAIQGVKRITKRDRIFYCGHSMGGMLGYGYAGIHDDFEGIVTIGAAADLGKGALPLKLLALAGPSLTVAVDAALGVVNAQRSVSHAVGKATSSAKRKANDTAEPPKLKYRYLPVDAWLQAAAGALDYAESSPLFSRLANKINWLARQDRMSAADIRWLLREGGEREPRKVVDQFLRWIRNGEMVCYRTGYDFKRAFGKIKVPMAIVFGDMDPLASVDSTRRVYRSAKSEYLLWRPVKGNSHIELTMGHDIRQICYDIKNLVEYARTHRHRSPVLPRIR